MQTKTVLVAVLSSWMLAAAAQVGLADNIQVGKPKLTLNPARKCIDVVFDLQWDNSWRTDENWDAAWVFLKYRATGSTHWQHVKLSANGGDHKAAAGVVQVPVDRVGAFIYRAANGTGNARYPHMTLRWDYGADGLAFASADSVEVSAYALEMVYIPEDSFYLGSGGNEDGRFYEYTDGSQNTKPFLVTSETKPITVGKAAGNLCYVDGGDGKGPISDSFPKGYAAFYCMKHQLTQGQYVDFLNTLTPGQVQIKDYQRNLDFIHKTIKDVTFTIDWNGTNFTAKSPELVCTWMGWIEGFGYAAWAGLRPMTELEYEKMCRGSAKPAPAPSGNSGREAVASCYGVVDLTGKFFERCVTVGSVRGRNFQGTHGSGTLKTNGWVSCCFDPGRELWTNADWEGMIRPYGNKEPHESITCYHGGGAPVSARGGPCKDSHAEGRHQPMVWRAVRTAPDAVLQQQTGK